MSAMRFGLGLGLGLGMAVEAFSGHARAQPASGSTRPTASPSAAAPSAATPTAGVTASPTAPTGLVNVNAPDVVRLKNGGLLRGTISELVPGDFVSIVLITGESRKVPYADVQYAGSSSDPANASAVAPSPAAAGPAATGARRAGAGHCNRRARN
jgi:hypothetical protein